MNVAQFLVTAVALVLLLTPLFLLSFLAGRRSHSARSSREFDRLRPDVVLEPGSWRTEFDGDDPDSRQVVQLNFEQVGCRIVATGRSLDGTRHAIEGILYQRRLCGICIEEKGDASSLGTVTAELLPGEQQIVGMRTRWSSQSKALIVRKVTFHRTF